MDPADLMMKLKSMDQKVFTVEKVKALRKNTEDIDDEKVKIQSHVDTHGIAVLSPAEKLIYEVSKFSHFQIFVEVFEEKITLR